MHKALVSPSKGTIQKVEGKPLVNASESEAEGNGEPEAWRPVTVEEAVRILGRLELSGNIRAVLGSLYHSAEPVSSEDLKKVLGHTGDMFRGMMGAFGRRVVTTVGKNVYFFGKEWRQDQYFWTLPGSAKRALEDLKIV